MHRAKYGEGAWGFHTLSEQDTLPNLQVFTSPGVLKTLPFWVFMEASLLRHDGWNHWQCNWLNLQSPSPFQRSGGETESSKPLITWLILQANSPHPFVVVFQSFSHVRLFATPWTTALQASLSFTISQSCSNSCPLSWWCHPTTSSSSGFNLSQHQGLFQWVGPLNQLASVLELQFEHQSFQWIFRVDFLYDSLVGSPLQSKWLSRVQHYMGLNYSWDLTRQRTYV